MVSGAAVREVVFNYCKSNKFKKLSAEQFLSLSALVAKRLNRKQTRDMVKYFLSVQSLTKNNTISHAGTFGPLRSLEEGGAVGWDITWSIAALKSINRLIQITIRQTERIHCYNDDRVGYPIELKSLPTVIRNCIESCTLHSLLLSYFGVRGILIAVDVFIVPQNAKEQKIHRDSTVGPRKVYYFYYFYYCSYYYLLLLLLYETIPFLPKYSSR